MQTSLRKMGNSTGMIVPRAILDSIGVTTGAAMDLTVVDGKLVATPVARGPRAGWSDAAIAIGVDPVDGDWLEHQLDADAALDW